MAPIPTIEPSVAIRNSSEKLCNNNVGALMRIVFNLLNASSLSFVHLNSDSFFSRSYKGLTKMCPKYLTSLTAIHTLKFEALILP